MKELTPLNTEKLIKDNIATEYRYSENLKRYVHALLCDHDVLDAIFMAIADRLNLDTQKGVNLDRIGEIVGQSRNVVMPRPIKFFGFSPHPQAEPLGDPDNPLIGGRFRSPGEALTYNKALDDDTYVQFIKSKIFRNHARSTPDELITLLKLLLGADTAIQLKTASPRPGHGHVYIEKRLSPEERYIVNGTDLVPNTVGVTYHYEFMPPPPVVINQFVVVAGVNN